jgi:acylphosphatase
MQKRAIIIVTGWVQGVGFRAHTQRKARALGVRGYVQNLDSGHVEIVAEGEAETIERLIQWCRQGPPLARVEDVKVEFADATGEFGEFSIQY